MNEEFAISLKTVFDQSSFDKIRKQLADFKKEFEKGMEVAVSPAVNATNKISPPSTQTTPANPMDMQGAKEYSAQIAYILSQIDDLTEKKRRIDLGIEEGDIFKIEAEIERLQNKLIQLQGNGNSGVAVVQKTTVNISNNLGKAVKQASRLVLALVGVRGLYGSIRKAMGTYLAQNTELQQKLNGAWYALGSLFAPVLEWIINLFATLVAYVNIFVKALGFAGINMSKYGKAAGKAGKETKQLAGFDEINNLSSNDDSGGGAGVADPFGGVKINENLKKFLEWMAEWLKKNLPFVLAVAAGLALWKIGSSIMEALPTLGLFFQNLGGLIVAVAGIFEYFVGLWDSLVNGASWDNITQMVLGTVAAFVGLKLLLGTTAAAFSLLIFGAGMLVAGLVEVCRQEELTEKASVLLAAGLVAIGIGIGLITGNWIPLLIAAIAGIILLVVGFKDKIGKTLKNVWETVKNFFKNLWKGLVDIGKKIKDFLSPHALNDKVVELFESVKTKVSEKIASIKQAISDKITDIKNTIGNIFSGIVGVVAGIWNLISGGASTAWNGIKNVVTGLVDGIKTGISDKFNSIKSGISDAWDNIKTTASNKLTGIKTTISGIWDTVKSNTSKSWDGISSGIGSQLAGIASKIANSGIAQKIKSLFNIRPEIKPIVKMPKIQASQTQNGNVFWTHVGTFTAQAYARGTDFVPNDQIALLHKGEAVIPKEYNDGIQGAPYMGGSETNNLLRELIDIVDTKEFRAYISQNEIGRTAVKYINNQSRIQGGSIV